MLAWHPFMTGKVLAAIYWQALRLWLKRTPFFTHPDEAAGSGAGRDRRGSRACNFLLFQIGLGGDGRGGAALGFPWAGRPGRTVLVAFQLAVAPDRGARFKTVATVAAVRAGHGCSTRCCAGPA